MASNILTVGKSALAAAQAGITTTGNNIANASTPGYHRQLVTQSASSSQNFGYGYVGTGTNVSSITRVFNELMERQKNSAQSNSSGIDAYYSQISGIDDMLSDSTAGLNPVMNTFFSSIEALSSNPSDTASRQTFLSSAQSLVSRFNTMANRLDELQTNVNTQIDGYVTSVNSYAEQISALNNAIETALNTTGNAPNDLMDQRDQLVGELSKLVKTTVVDQGAGTYNVFIGNGLPLVVGNESYTLAAVTSPSDTSRTEIAYYSNGNETILDSSNLSGGSLGGLLEFRSETLDITQNKLGQIALVLASKFNETHKNGFDLNGTAGGDLFTLPSIQTQLKSTYDDGHTVGNAALSVSINDATDVLSSDYKLAYDGTNYNITRLSDNSTVSSSASLPATVDGLTFTISSGTMATGDEFYIYPTRSMASSLTLAISDVNKLAMASSATSGPNDNTNALALTGIQSTKLLKTSSSDSVGVTLSTAFAQIVSEVGSKTNELKITGKSATSVLSSITEAVEAESGVNLDEEAANLIRYQQAYQAAGKMMQIATELFQVLLSLNNA